MILSHGNDLNIIAKVNTPATKIVVALPVGSRIGDQRGGGSDYLRVNSKLLSKTVSYPNPKGSPARKLPLGRHL